jgi:hypothetical protein
MVTIFDSLYSRFEIKEPISKLLKTPEITRIGDIKQLGLGFISFPGAVHTRKEHSIGTTYLAQKLAKELDLDEIEQTEIQVAALLHDIAHGPFSHTTDNLLEKLTDKNHAQRVKEMVLGETHFFAEDEEWISKKIKEGDLYNLRDVLKEIGVEPEKIANIIVNEDVPEYLGQIISSSFDVDRMDFILRDSKYTGITHGIHDPKMLLNYIKIPHERDFLVYDKRGLTWLEQFVMARLHMYGDVYFEKNKRVLEKMVERAMEYLTIDKKEISPEQLQTMTDTDTLNALKRYKETLETVRRIRYNIPLETVLEVNRQHIGHIELRRLDKVLSNFKLRREIERKIIDDIKMDDPTGVILDMMKPPAFEELAIDIIDEDGRIQSFSDHSYVTQQLVNTLERRYWFFRVYSHSEYRNKVRDLTIKTLNDYNIDLTYLAKS